MTQQQLSTSRFPQVIGHRGASGLALENSLAAFRLAAEAVCDGVELDIHLSRDGALVVHHDPKLPTGESIASLSLAEIRIRPLGDGHPAPTLAEVLAATPGLQVYIEAKTLPAEADGRLLELILTDSFPARLHVHAFDHRIIVRLARQAPWLSLGVLSASYPLDPIGPVLDAGAHTLWQARELTDESLIARCRESGIAVIAWTVNDAVEAARLATLGVAGLCGNWPDRLRPTRHVEGAP